MFTPTSVPASGSKASQWVTHPQVLHRIVFKVFAPQTYADVCWGCPSIFTTADA
jgi:hypothetical protein